LEDCIMPVNLSKVAASRSNWPAWHLRGRVKRVSSQGDIIENEYAFGGEFVRISPRFVKGGRTYRVRFERPAAALAAWLYEQSILPTRLTPEEAESEAGLELLDPLWAKYKGHFYKLESPNAACDHATQPSLRTGFSFCVLQVLVEEVGSVRGRNGSHGSMMLAHVQGDGENHDALRKKIEELRARAGRPDGNSPTKGKK
jgi:hypothetical protein